MFIGLRIGKLHITFSMELDSVKGESKAYSAFNYADAVNPDYASNYPSEDTGDTAVSDHVSQRDSDIDSRMQSLQHEIMQYDSDGIQTDLSIAEELHADVHNIPHDIIDKVVEVLPDVEETE